MSILTLSVEKIKKSLEEAFESGWYGSLEFKDGKIEEILNALKEGELNKMPSLAYSLNSLPAMTFSNNISISNASPFQLSTNNSLGSISNNISISNASPFQLSTNNSLGSISIPSRYTQMNARVETFNYPPSQTFYLNSNGTGN